MQRLFRSRIGFRRGSAPATKTNLIIISGFLAAGQTPGNFIP
jgi:hypothetical protein